MKVRIKNDQHMEEHAVLECSDSFYIVPSRHSNEIHDALPKSICEIISDEQWEDVTAECAKLGQASWMFGHKVLPGQTSTTWPIATPGPGIYRLRQVVLRMHSDQYAVVDDGSRARISRNGAQLTVFIVERLRGR